MSPKHWVSYWVKGWTYTSQKTSRSAVASQKSYCRLTNNQYLLLWSPVPPIVANTFFERRFNSDPLILQYAHRVLAQHPVELTFFFIPQVVQALRYDDLGKEGFSLFHNCVLSYSQAMLRVSF